ncbi:MAG TPA: ABC transporter substrate-binding protein [Pyrinomonadaceae bacterium]|nr:ABC transporter substrate-binding protein [Pyrinomonadaceae bacterium]
MWLSIFPFTTQAQVLTAAERRGKEIYLRGTSPSGREITGRIGEIDVPASTVSCAGCHGMRGEGKTEGGVAAGNLTWPHLSKPYGHTHPTGRKHGPFNDSSFTRAVVNGIDSDGNELQAVMPRYKLSAEDMADLIAYVKRIDSDLDPGITESSIRVGLVLPSQGALADISAAMKDVFSAYFEDLNSRGGIFSRKIDLRIADAGTGGAATATVAQTFAHREEIFAFVGGLSAGADAQIAALAREEQIPFIGPSTLLPYAETPANRYLFYLLPGVSEQAVALVNFAQAQPELRDVPVAIVHPDNSLGTAAAVAADEQLKKTGRRVGTKKAYASDNFDARSIVADLKNKGARVVFFFGTGKEQASFLNEASAVNWTPHLFFLGVMTGKELPVPVAAFKHKLFIAFPTLPADVKSEAVAEFRSLQEKYKFVLRHTASQLAAFATAKVFVEGLTRGGRDLSREKLITSLEGLYEYETGITPRITFGPNRRVGAAGAHVLSLDLTDQEFSSASGWIKAY